MRLAKLSEERPGFVHFSIPSKPDRVSGNIQKSRTWRGLECLQNAVGVVDITLHFYSARLLFSLWRDLPAAKMHLILPGPGFRCACSAAMRLCLSPRCRIFKQETVCGCILICRIASQCTTRWWCHLSAE